MFKNFFNLKIIYYLDYYLSIEMMLNKKINRDKKNKIKIKDNELDKGLSDLDSDLSHSSEKSNPKIKNLTPKSNNSIDENPIEKKQHLNIHELKNQIEKKSKNQKPPSKKQFQKIAYPSSPSSSPEKIEVQKTKTIENFKKTSKKIESQSSKSHPSFPSFSKIPYTLSIVIPSSIIDNAQSKELRTYLIGNIARTIGIFKVSEIIIYHDKLHSNPSSKDHITFFIKNLQYLETPQYLRKTLFPISDDLTRSGLMNPLESQHHLRIDEWCPYREGIVLNRPVKGDFSWVNIGLKKDCKINKKLPEKTRVTVKLNENGFNDNLKFYSGIPVSMREPFEKFGIYWGYIVRVCENFNQIFNESIYGEKYDLIIGTSDKGDDYRKVNFDKVKNFKHCLIVFGGITGIEGMIDDDENEVKKGNDVKDFFDFYLNTCVNQGLRTIRTEEAVLISLAVIRPELDKIKGIC